VRHTFIEVTLASEQKGTSRCRSCPPKCWLDSVGANTCRSCPDNSWANKWQEKAFIMDSMHPVRSSSVHDSEQSTFTDKGMYMMHERNDKKKGCARSCKGKRLRFRKFVQRLKADIESKAEFFDMNKVAWPPSLEANSRKRHWIIEQMEQYQHQVIREKVIRCSDSARSEAR